MCGVQASKWQGSNSKVTIVEIRVEIILDDKKGQNKVT